MKSAYELAMERLERESPSGPAKLSEAQKAELKKIDERYSAKKAERKIFLEQQVQSARQKGDQEALAQLERQIADEMTRIEEEKEAAKEKVRHASKS